MLRDNPNYKEIYNKDGVVLYQPADGQGYHTSRYVAAGAQDIYSASGSTKEFIERVANHVKQICEDQNNKVQLRTDTGTLMNNLLYRLRYPVDEDCAIRMGAIYCLLEDEDPEQVNPMLTEQKVKLAHKYPYLYTFFLTVGIIFTPSWKDIDPNSLDGQYFQERREALKSLLPPDFNQ